ncbi:hypothetical protein ACK3SF_04025 [Candidatus Nanosalina sp. VS9-1]|uniref:hypothetical protein n=1 Tax=Candidatus Nanosalina sp. VS9-1 TaxID=3388566 RepID=UPI0039E035B1
MGRTNSTYRNHLDNFIDGFKPFRQALRKENKQHLDSLWEKAHQFAQAGAYLNSSQPSLPAFISMMLGVQKEASENRKQIEELKERVEELES